MKSLSFRVHWLPFFCFIAVNDLQKGTTSYGLGLRVEDLRQARFCYFCSLIRSYSFTFINFSSSEYIWLMNEWIFTKCSYQRADPNYVMLTPNKEHLAPGVLREYGKRPMFQTQIDSGNYDHLPTELKPIGRIFWLHAVPGHLLLGAFSARTTSAKSCDSYPS